MKTVLGIDCSTQSSTVVERNLDTGETISVSKSPHPVTHPPNSEQHPESWWSAFKENLKDIDRSRVTAMSVAGQGHGLVVLDSENQIIRPAKLWNDTTSTKQSEELINSIDFWKWSGETNVKWWRDRPVVFTSKCVSKEINDWKKYLMYLNTKAKTLRRPFKGRLTRRLVPK